MRLVIGTRPEAIKLQPVARALLAHGVAPRLVFTGQHKLDPGDFGLDGFPVTHLGCEGRADPHAHAKTVAGALRPTFDDRPDLMIVQGDTSSAFGAALAASQARIPFAHVEAGLRTHDRLPWPEEEYRVAIDACADLLFAPTDLSAANLAAETVGGRIHVTGNTAVDAVLAAERQLQPITLRERGIPQILVTCHRRESWCGGLGAIAAAIGRLAVDGTAHVDVVLHPNPFVASTMRDLLGPVSGVTLIPPCTHVELLGRMRDADLVLSDSGGIQEEAPALGVPLLVLRDKTERPEGLATGTTRLVGTDTAAIVTAVCDLLADPISLGLMSRPAFPFGDGRAGERIAAIVAQWLDESR